MYALILKNFNLFFLYSFILYFEKSLFFKILI